MNTVEKGNELENKIYNLLKPLVDEGIYGKYAILHQHKKYKADAGFKDLDVTIDLFTSKECQEKDDPYSTIVFECKNYKTKVNAGRYDEWIGKLERLGSSRYKIFLVTTVGFSEETIQSAQIRGIGLIVLTPECQFNYVLQRSINDNNSYNYLIDDLTGKSHNHPILVYDQNRFTTLIDTLISNQVPVNEKYLVHAPHYSRKCIETKVQNLIGPIKQWNKSIDTLNLVLSKFPDLSVKYQNDLPSNLLGKLVLNTKEIILNTTTKECTGRERFTLAHELGHYVLHYHLIEQHIHSFGDTEKTLIKNIQENESKSFEIQANIFASCLLMPQQAFIVYTHKAFKIFNINRGRLYVDLQECNLENYHLVANYLSKIFNVSKAAVKYRMLEFKLLILDKTARI